MQNIIEKAPKAFNGQTEPPPTLNSKGWWANRAIALEIELKSNQAVDEERQQRKSRPRPNNDVKIIAASHL